MPLSTRLTVASHILTALALAKGQPRRSCDLAESAGSHATVIRQLLSRLCEAGLVHSRLGPGGGALLARDAAAITLLDVYHAVEKGEIVTIHQAACDQPCRVGRHIREVLEPVAARAQAAFCHSLGETTIADLARSIDAAEAGKVTPK